MAWIDLLADFVLW